MDGCMRLRVRILTTFTCLYACLLGRCRFDTRHPATYIHTHTLRNHSGAERIEISYIGRGAGATDATAATDALGVRARSPRFLRRTPSSHSERFFSECDPPTTRSPRVFFSESEGCVFSESVSPRVVFSESEGCLLGVRGLSFRSPRIVGSSTMY